MPEVVARVGIGDLSAVIDLEVDTDDIGALCLTARTQAVALLEDAMRSPEIRALLVDDDAPEADIAPEDVAGESTEG